MKSSATFFTKLFSKKGDISMNMVLIILLLLGFAVVVLIWYFQLKGSMTGIIDKLFG